jgi:hypothetical protein
MAINPLGVSGGNGNVVVETEALFPSAVVGVMTGRTQSAKGVFYNSIADGLHSAQGPGNRQLRNGTGCINLANRRDVLCSMYFLDVLHRGFQGAY